MTDRKPKECITCGAITNLAMCSCGDWHCPNHMGHKETMEDRFKTANMRHYMCTEGSEIDGIVWVSSDDVKAFIKSELQRQRDEILKMVRERQRRWLGNSADYSDRHEHYDELEVFINSIKDQ